MSKKDYIAIGNILKKHSGKFFESVSSYNNQLVNDFIELFQKDNPLFDEQRFLDYINED